MNVHWTEAALTDLRAAEAYLARHSPRYAQSVIDRIFERSAQLEQMPELGAVVPEYEDAGLRELFESPYRIIYRILEQRQQVDVLAVVHGSRRLPRGLS